MRTPIQLFVAFSLWVLAAGSALAQTGAPGQAPMLAAPTGVTVAGVVLDASGGALPGTTATLASPADPANPLLQVTDAVGAFQFIGVPPGSYSLVLSLPGFQEQHLNLNVGRENPISLKIALEMGTYSETVEVHADGEARLTVPTAPVGEAKVEERQLAALPLTKERFEDALPLIPSVVRGPDGLLNMNGARAAQSTLLVNGVNATDPVTGGFAIRLPLEAVESVDVRTSVYSAEFGSATGGIANVITKAGQDKWDVNFQNFFPRFRYKNGGFKGIDAFVPRLRVGGPIKQGRLWFSQAFNYRFIRSRVNELRPLDESEEKLESFDSLTQIDYAIGPKHHLMATLSFLPSGIDNLRIDTLHPFEATPDLRQRAWNAGVGERAILNASTVLESAFAVKQFNVDIFPKAERPSRLTVTGVRGNYFNHFDRDSRRYDLVETLTTSIQDRWGDHLLKVGGNVAHTSFQGIDASLPVEVVRANGTLSRRIEFAGDPRVGGSNTEVAGFIEDQWSAASRLTLHLGLRYDHEEIAGQHTVAPRLAVSFTPSAEGRTVLKAGFGRFYDKIQLNTADFARHQQRRVTEFGDDGETLAGPPVLFENRLPAEGLRQPRSNAWNIEVDRLLTPSLVWRAGYQERHGSRELIVNPLADRATLLLSSQGRSRSREFETTVRRSFGQKGQLTFTYVRSKTEGNLNDFVSLFGDSRDPLIRPDEFSRQDFDAPNRFLFWGVLNLPRKITVSPTVEYRDGFPYSLVDQDQRFLGRRNRGGRFPDSFTVDLRVTKDIHLTKKQRARVGFQVFNITNHFNPRDVQNNIGSPILGTFANSVGRQIRGKFILLF